MLAITFAALIVTAGTARAEIGPELTSFGVHGSGPGQLYADRQGGIAANPVSGDIYLTDVVNNRIVQFTAWGEFVRAWGWGVADGTSEVLQTCVGTCFVGRGGTGPGQMALPNGIAVAPGGDVYVFEVSSRRTQVFSATGEFKRMFGGEVNKTSGEDICTQSDVEGGDTCAAGVTGTGPSEFSIIQRPPTTGRDYIDISPGGTVYVGDQDRIQTFELDGTFKEAIPLPEPGGPAGLSVDPVSGDIYFGYAYGNTETLTDQFGYRLSPTGAVVYALPTLGPIGFATDVAGFVYAAEQPVFTPTSEGQRVGENRVVQFDSAGIVTDSCCVDDDATIAAVTTNVVTESGDSDVYVFHSGHSSSGPDYIEIRGPAPDKWPPPVVPPTIEEQYAVSVGTEAATVEAKINPNFWEDTRYFLEYGTEPCSGGGCTKTPAPPGTLLGAGIVKKAIPTGGIDLEGLAPATTYHYRFVAESTGGPTTGPDATFTTFALAPAAETNCSNQQFRTGLPSTGLPDCRAYEMVSPVEKLGGDVLVQCTQICLRARLNQGSREGDRISYSSYRAFGDVESSPYTSQYLADRGPGGWTSKPISPLREPPSLIGTASLDSQYRGFTEDLTTGWLLHDTEPALTPGAVVGYTNLYRRQLGSGQLEAVTNEAPQNEAPVINYIPVLQGFSADGSRTFFSVPAKLTANASAAVGRWQLYELHEGQIRLVSVRPNNGASIADAWAGWGSESGVGAGWEGRAGNPEGAVSEDGTRVYWTDLTNASAGIGKIYVREEATKSYGVSLGEGTFWAATPSGSHALYTESGELKRFDFSTKASEPLATGVIGVMGQSTDLSRIYFASSDPLAGGAVEGKPNLFLHEDGSPIRFITTLSTTDLNVEPAVSPVTSESMRRVARVSIDGGTAIFMSRASLTGAENIDAVSGKPDAEVFRYDAASDQLICVSCSPSGARPSGDEYERNKSPSGYWYASKIPGWEFQLHAPRALSDDGSRVFFDSFNRLVSADTNERQDVYQWEAVGTGRCTESNPSFSAQADGCVALISSGSGSAEFIDASATGGDVFFTTGTGLVPQDKDQVDLYDARVNGGFAPPVTPSECSGETCQTPAAPPGALPNVSQNFFGPGNPHVKPRKHKRHKKHSRHKKGQKHKKKGKAKKKGSKKKHQVSSRKGKRK